MTTRVDPNLIHDLKEYGAVGIEKCFNCGNCTAICPLTSDEYPFPRNMIRLTQVGMKERMKNSLDPWLCYYCGDCSDTCPKGAEPAESMMSMRRWLIGQYDWTGLAKKFYTSEIWEFGSMIIVGLVTVLLVVLLSGPMVTSQVEINTFAPIEIVHTADWILAGILLFFIGTNVLRMFYLTMIKGSTVKVPISAYITEAWQLVVHALTQKRWATCAEDEEDESIRRSKRTTWLLHILLVSGYGLMLVLIIFFLPWFQTDTVYPVYHPQRSLGYYATIALLVGAGYILYGRIRKEKQLHRFSHPSDWIFPVLLLIVTITGIFQHLFRVWGFPLLTYYTYTVHLFFVAPMLLLEVPFGKWAHLYYRPLAVYFQAVREKAVQIESNLAAEPAAAD